MKFLKKSKGFTLIELLVVVAIIGVLATIVLSSLSEARARARDAKRKSDLAQIGNALQIWALDNGDMWRSIGDSSCGYIGSPYPHSAYGGGWLTYSGGANFDDSVIECLFNSGYLGSEIYDPLEIPNVTTSSTPLNDSHKYVKYSCLEGTYLYAKLEGVPQSSTATDNTCSGSADTSLGMNYWIKID